MMSKHIAYCFRPATSGRRNEGIAWKQNFTCFHSISKRDKRVAGRKFPFLVLLCLTFMVQAMAQIDAGNAWIEGRVTDPKGEGIPVVAVGIVNLERPIGTATDENGHYRLQVPSNSLIRISFSHTSYHSVQKEIRLQPGESRIIDIILQEAAVQMEEVKVQGTRSRGSGYISISPLESKSLPSITGGVEGLLMALPGVNSNNELSSQYSVRGGNFDENLVYVNGIEVYRPFLTRSGEQEGMSFVNPDLVQNLTFSSGGFDAKYGDKMSSVLDIRYKTPTEFAGSFGINFMGGHLHLEGASKDQKFTYLIGLRQRNSQWVLKGLDKTGQYKPSFTDFQTLLTYQFDGKNKLELLGNIAHNLLCAKLVESYYVGDAVDAILAAHIVDDLVAAPLAEVDVKVRRGNALQRKHSFKQQIKAYRLYVGDFYKIGYHAACAATASGADGNPVCASPIYKVPNNQEVIDESRADNN